MPELIAKNPSFVILALCPAILFIASTIAFWFSSTLFPTLVISPKSIFSLPMLTTPLISPLSIAFVPTTVSFSLALIFVKSVPAFSPPTEISKPRLSFISKLLPSALKATLILPFCIRLAKSASAFNALKIASFSELALPLTVIFSVFLIPLAVISEILKSFSPKLILLGISLDSSVLPKKILFASPLSLEFIISE